MEKSRGGKLKPGNNAVFSIEDHITPRYPEAAIDQFQLFNIDSSLISPEHWVKLAEMIDELYGDYSGFIVIHGTDTLSYTAAAMSFMLKNLDKPVVLTGSQLPFFDRRSDAYSNLVSSLDVVIDGRIKEVVVVFNNKVYRGNRVKKRDVWDFHAFYSPNMEILAKLGIGIDIRRNSAAGRIAEEFSVDTRICMDVLSVSFFPGLDFSFYLPMISDNRIRGILIEAYGSGNIPSDNPGLDLLFMEASRNDIPIVVCSQSPVGRVDLELYEAAEKALFYGLISAGDMTKEAALVKLMAALGRYDDMSGIKSFMISDISGERTV